MKKALIIFAVLALSMSLMAQQRAGTIYGKIVDAEKNALPGVTLTLNSPDMAPMTTVTSETGMYRFPAIAPGTQYALKAELQGFKSIVQGDIIVNIGANTEVNLTLEVGKLEEQVTVTAASPVVDTKKTTTAMSINKEEMQSLPTARDPWTLFQLAPSIMVDRENVGGNESGQQSGFIAKGDTSGSRISGNQNANNIWAIDGIDITDPAALGGSALYYDYDMFEEMNIQTGGAADVSIQTGGIAVNMVTRRGGNKLSMAGRFYLTDNYFQASNLTQSLKDQGVVDTNKIKQIKDYGFSIGGPLLKDKLWFWGAYGIQDIFNYTIPQRVQPYSATGTAPPYTVPAQEYKVLLANYNLKLNAQLLANNRLEVMVTSGNKEMFGRDSTASQPGGNHQQANSPWGSPIYKIQDEHVFGNNLYLSAKFSYNNAGFKWRPVTDEAVAYPIVYDQTLSQYVPWTTSQNRSWGSYGVNRPRTNWQLNLTYFNDTFLGLSHEIKVGAELSKKHQATESSGTGNIQGFDITRNYNSVALDVNADGTRTAAEMAGWQRVSLYRRSGSHDIAQQWAAFIQDTITKGNFTFTLGLRFDKQWPGGGAYIRDVMPNDDATNPSWNLVFDTATTSLLTNYITPVEVRAVGGNPQIVNGSDRPYQWNTFSPRIGVTWDITGDGKTVAKLALSEYGDIMGVGWYQASPAASGGSINTWWRDGTGGPADSKMQYAEMYWAYSTRNPVANPAIPGLPYRYVPYRLFNDNGTLTTEATAMLAGGYNSDAYAYGNYSGYNFLNPAAELDYETRTQYFLNQDAQSSSRTREALLTLEREIVPNFAASINFTYRKYDNNQINLRYYPEEHSSEYPSYTGLAIIDPRETPPAGGTWYVPAGTIPENYIVGGTWALVNGIPVNTGGTTYDSGNAANRDYWLPGPNMPTTSTRYAVIRKNDAWFEYMGFDLVVTKRLSNRWFMNGSFTYQDQTTHWGQDFFNPTNQWAFDGKSYGDWGGAASGKTAVLMFTRWMVKVSGLYQLPYGFDLSGTFNAREGWKVPQYFYIMNDQAPNYNQGYYTIVYKDPYLADSLPTFYNLSLRLEKRVNIGAGRFYFMADLFNVFNSNMPIRSYSKYDGDAYYRNIGGVSTQYTSWKYAFNGMLNEILNPRILRLGVRFEF